MNIIDSATVSVLLVVLAVAVFAAVVTIGFAVRLYVASRPARPVRRPAIAVPLAH
jgi:cell division protein FtsX